MMATLVLYYILVNMLPGRKLQGSLFVIDSTFAKDIRRLSRCAQRPPHSSLLL